MPALCQAHEDLRDYSDVPDTDGWALFTPYGSPLRKSPEILRAFEECGTVYVYEGGNFQWPGVRVGHTITLSMSTDDDLLGEVTMTTLSLNPRAFTIAPLLTDEECEFIQMRSPRNDDSTLKDGDFYTNCTADDSRNRDDR